MARFIAVVLGIAAMTTDGSELTGQMVENDLEPPMPVITLFEPDFPQGPTTEVPNVSWKIEGPFDRVALTIDDVKIYSGDSRCGEGRWRDLCRPGTHRLVLTVGYGEVEVTARCFYTALLEGDEPALLPMIGYFYPDYYVGKKDMAPLVHWDTLNISSFEIWLDGTCILMSQNASGEFRFSQLNTPGSYVVRMVAHNAIDDAEASFCYRCEAPETREAPELTFAPSPKSVGAAPVISEFYADTYEASILKTPYVHWNLVGEVDSMWLTVDNVPVFIGDGHIGNGRWLDLSLLNVDELSGSHEVSLSVSNSVGVATSNFTYTCHWEEPPPPPKGSEENPWQVGDEVQAYTNGVGGLIFTGSGVMDDFASAADVPWTAFANEITEVTISDGVTKVGKNALISLADAVTVNDVALSRYRMIAGAMGMIEAPGSAITPAEVERVKVAGGNAQLEVTVATNSNPEATTEGWVQANILAATVVDGKARLTVPADFANGYMILRTKDAESTSGGVKSAQTVGMLSVQNSAKQAAVGVPFGKIGGHDGQPDQDALSVADVLGAMELAVGDLIHVYNGSTQKYQSWRWTGSAWEGVNTVTKEAITSAKSASEVSLKRGSAFWLERANTEKPVILAGRYVTTGTTSTIGTGTSEQKAWNLIASPKTESFDLNAVVKGEKLAKDQILVPTEGAPVIYTYEGGAWGCMVNEKVDLGGGLIVVRPRRSTAASDTTIPAGRGFWYISAGGTPSFEW